MSDILARALKQYQDKVANSELLSIEVKEWPDEQGKPTLIYFKPLGTLPVREYNQFLNFAKEQTLEAAIDLIILRALNDDKSKMFKAASRAEMVRGMDAEVVLSILSQMGEADKSYRHQLEDSEKN